jgi:tripartite-type tricarboxylate transporter receptor subunit TctC
MGFLAPAGTTSNVVEKVARDVNVILKNPEIISKLKLLGTYELGSTTLEFDAFIKDERRKWERVVKDARIEAE